LVDPAAGGDVLGVVVEQCLREVEHRLDARVGDPVEDDAVLAARLDEAAPAQAGEVIGDLRLRHAEPLDQLAYGKLARFAQLLEDAQPGRVPEAAEVLRDKVAPRWRPREPEGRYQRAHIDQFTYQNLSPE
jgi:hypothetical protein